LSASPRIGGLVASRIAAPLAAALLATACSSGPAIDTGPLGNGGDPGGLCSFLAPGVVLSYGATLLENTGQSAVVVQKVDLVQPRHLQLVASYVVPTRGNFEVGVWDGFPPGPQPGVEWSQRMRAAGARIPPAHGTHRADLLTVLKPTGPVAEAQAIDVFYREGGQQYHMQTHVRFVLLVGRHCPANWPLKYPG